MIAKSQQQLKALLDARSVSHVEAILSSYPIVDPETFQLDHDGKPVGKWRDSHLHWLPVGRDRGNGGRIKLAGHPTNPIAERLVNGMEAVIELERLRELAHDKASPMPITPRDAVMRYFGLPRLDSIPHMDDPTLQKKCIEAIDFVREKLHVKLAYDKSSKQFSVIVRDRGMGQRPDRIHRTLLSLGQTDKADKPYMIGVFGQGGSSAFATSDYSIIISRRAFDIAGPGGDGIGWSIVRQIFPKARRDPYFAYLAASLDGQVPSFDADVADAAGFDNGSQFCHIKYDFGGSGSAVARALYQALNHVLFNPILPYDLFTIEKERPELMQGTAQRLARRTALIGPQNSFDRSFVDQPVGAII
jgi:hypothetical protein